MEMLEETVDELRGTPATEMVDPEIRLPVAARLPEDYVPDVSQRLVLYKRLAERRATTRDVRSHPRRAARPLRRAARRKPRT